MSRTCKSKCTSTQYICLDIGLDLYIIFNKTILLILLVNIKFGIHPVILNNQYICHIDYRLCI